MIRSSADNTSLSSGGSSITGQGTSLALSGVITTNLVLSKANASVVDSFVTASGDVTVSATNASQIDATTESTSSSGANALGIQLAFNSIGWKATNLLYNALDALIGDPTIQGAFGGQQPAETIAFVSGSRVHAGGDINVSALSQEEIFALVGNSATSAPAAIFGAGGMSVSAVLASSMVASVVRAYVDGSTLGADYLVTDTPSGLNLGDRVLLATAACTSSTGTPRGPPQDFSTEDFSSTVIGRWSPAAASPSRLRTTRRSRRRPRCTQRSRRRTTRGTGS